MSISIAVLVFVLCSANPSASATTEAANPGERGTPEVVRLNSNGWILVGDLELPSSSEPAPAALLLNRAAGSRTAYSALSARLTELGIAAFSLDLRAHGESTNRGTFGPPYGETRHLMQGTQTDIEAALQFLESHPHIDGKKIAIVGASYSAEFMVAATLQSTAVAAYAALSPGSFSEESVSRLENSQAPWLFVRSLEERAELKSTFESIREINAGLDIWVLPGSLHATDMLGENESFVENLAMWIDSKLDAD
jgi:dienelactone hydrolase